MSEEKAAALGLTALARVAGWAYVGVDPADQLLIGPALAMPRVLARAGLELRDVDLVDMHEAFAAQVLSVLKMLASDAFARARLGRAMARRLDGEKVALERAVRGLDARRVVGDRRQMLDALAARLRELHPRARLVRDRAALEKLDARLATAMQDALRRRRRALDTRMGKLDALSPLRVLDRGYAIATRKDGHAVRDPNEVSDGDELTLRLARGRLTAVVKSREPK